MEKYLTPDQVSFYDDSAKQQIEGCYRYDGKEIHVASAKYGAKSVSRGACIAITQVDALARKVLSELARESAAGSQIYKKAA